MAAKRIDPKEEKAKKTCFVIMPFSDPEGYAPGHFRSVYDYTFVPAIREAGYEPLRIDDNSVSSLIHGKMMNELITAPMCLCDLSTNNPNVLYELGIRHAFDLPVVLVQEIGQDRIFDIAGITSVEYHRTRLFEEVIDDQKRITDAIKQTANAKNKYSVMSLVALHAAKPTTGESVTIEDRLEYFMRDMSQKINSLEKRFTETQSRSGEPRYPDNRTPARDSFSSLLNEAVNEAEQYLFICDFDSTMASMEDTKKYWQNLTTLCRDPEIRGVDRVLRDHAYKAMDELAMLLINLREKDPDQK